MLTQIKYLKFLLPALLLGLVRYDILWQDIWSLLLSSGFSLSMSLLSLAIERRWKVVLRDPTRWVIEPILHLMGG